MSDVIVNPLSKNESFIKSPELESGINPFQKRFQNLSDAEYREAMLASVSNGHAEVIPGIPWPSYPPASLQQRIHGHANEHSLREAFLFYETIKIYLAKLDIILNNSQRFIDFGSGWGRMVRPFMKETSLKNIIGLEPNPYFVSLSRRLNPYVAFINGDYRPPTLFKDASFDLIFSWSVFSHLPDWLAKEWLDEFCRILRPGGTVFITTWGQRFIDRLKRENQVLESGNPIHFYSEIVIKAAGDLTVLENNYQSGRYVFLKSGASDMYGESFVSYPALTQICSDLNIMFHDAQSLPQDLFVLQKS